MNEPGIWRTTVQETITIFGSALQSLLPAMAEARIPWKEPAAYDDWDRIASALYESIVLDSIKYSESHAQGLEFGIYGLLQGDYGKLSYISVKVDTFTGAFVELLPDASDKFRIVRAVALDEELHPGLIHEVDAASIEFGASVRRFDGSRSHLRELAVEL